MILVLLVSIFISMLIPRTIFGVEILGFYRVLIKLLILPLIVGIGYELIKIAGRRDNVLTKIISFPGVLLQHISVIEPDDGMIEWCNCRHERGDSRRSGKRQLVNQITAATAESGLQYLHMLNHQ